MIEYQNNNRDIPEVIKSNVIKAVDQIILQYNLSLFKDTIMFKILDCFEVNNLKLKRRKNSIPESERCKGRKMDGCQCSRRCKLNSNYCGSHQKNLPYGYIDDGIVLQLKEKGKRGRKKKGDMDVKNNNFIETWVDIELGDNYLIDKHNLVYKYDLDYPELIGVKKNGIIVELDEVPSELFK